MKIAVTSDYDKDNKEQESKNFYAFKQYQQFLASRGVKHTGGVITKVKFDPATAYPKLLFSPERFLSDDEADNVIPMVKAEETKSLLAGTYTPAGADGVPTGESASSGAGTKSKDFEIEDAPAAEPEPQKSEAEVIEMKKEETPKEEKKAEAASTNVPDDIQDLISEWS